MAAITLYFVSKYREWAKDNGVIITDHNYASISTVADNLFVIGDGYICFVRSREDLVL
ncbi:MAG: hypothetical protein SPJ03_01455 [Candidatus Cryptobacteroides sp.]|nr:hypothetical protein [Candidatus Cryptobacteroides sp.]